jgi:hypothetical protein
VPAVVRQLVEGERSPVAPVEDEVGGAREATSPDRWRSRPMRSWQVKLGASSPTAGMDSSLMAPRLPNSRRGLGSGGQEGLPEPTRFAPPRGWGPARLCNARKAARLSSFSLRTAGPSFLEPTVLGAESWPSSHSDSSSLRKGHAFFCCCPPVAFSPRIPCRRDSCSAASIVSGSGGEA